ncbi:MAG: STAS/SEC14 domain-containing protein [Pyrinomonadaceae bacterium]|nr:STAS/SEC14 domain-containing protein [Pyrinomonadaceae bacterium]
MLRIGKLNENGVLTINVSGSLTKEDFDRHLPELEILLEQQDMLRFFIKLEDFSGYELDALWEDIKFDHKHKNQYGKTAIVGEKRWEEWGTKLSSLFFDAKMKFFYNDQSDEAWKWVNS